MHRPSPTDSRGCCSRSDGDHHSGAADTIGHHTGMDAMVRLTNRTKINNIVRHKTLFGDM